MNGTPSSPDNRRIRIFVSSTFRDMVEDRNELMTHAWPELRKFCRERQVELVEVDLRWGISQEQATRKETLKLCLDEIRACRPYFIGLLGERYGWVPDAEAFTADLLEEQPWLARLRDRSVTELEIIHGVLREEQMPGRAFFYFRDPAFVNTRPKTNRTDFATEDTESTEKLRRLKEEIRHASAEQICQLRENYTDPRQLVAFVLEDLKAVIDGEFPIASIPDALTREAHDHEAFAEIRRRTYIGRADYFTALDQHATGVSPSPPSEGGEGGGEVGDHPLVLLGDSGSGKSALIANWLPHWKQQHPRDFIFQHYIGGTPDSAEHWRLMSRLIAEIKRWTADPEDLPRSHDDILKTFPVWLAKARLKAERDGVRCLVVLDALNQLEDHDHARGLGWLPEHPFTGPLRLIVSTLPGEPLDAVKKRRWADLRVEPLTGDERRRMIDDYLLRFGKKLDAPRRDRLAAAPAAANPLYLKILLDELRVTGTHERLDERLNDYLAAANIPALLRKVLARYQCDYERDRPGLVGEALGLIWAARRGLTETELLELLRPADLPQLPLANWTPLRAVLEEGLVNRAGVLNFAHDFLRAAVEAAFATDQDKQDDLRIRLADYFEQAPVSVRSCDELPWLLWQAEERDRLRACLLDITRFLGIQMRDQGELMRYWLWLGEERTMGEAYRASFEQWSAAPGLPAPHIAYAANQLAYFLKTGALHSWAEPLYSLALAIDEQNDGTDHPNVTNILINLAQLLSETNRLVEAEALLRRAFAADEKRSGPDDPTVARDLGKLAKLLETTNRPAEAEPLMRRALAIDERNFGSTHVAVAKDLSGLAQLLQATTTKMDEVERLFRRALTISEQRLGPDHPDVAGALNNLALLLKQKSRFAEAEPLYCRALAIDELNFGRDHPEVATDLNNLAGLLYATEHFTEAEGLLRRALAIDERAFGSDNPKVAIRLNNLAELLRVTNRPAEAEPLLHRALAINKQHFGDQHPRIALGLSNLALVHYARNQLREAEPLMRGAIEITLKIMRDTGHSHPRVKAYVHNYSVLLADLGYEPHQILAKLNEIGRPYGFRSSGPTFTL